MSERNMPFLPLFFDAYLVDTLHLRTVEHGAYFLLLGHAWRRGGYLPDDDEELASLVRLTLEEWLAIKARVMAFWKVSKRGWSQKRLLKEIRTAAAARSKKREAGKKGGEAKASKQREKHGSTATAVPEQKASKTVAPIPIPIPIPTEDTPPEGSPAGSGYVWAGRVVRLNQADHDRWRQVYHGIADFEAALQAADDWIGGESAAAQKRWFPAVSAFLSKRHEAAMAARQPREQAVIRGSLSSV